MGAQARRVVATVEARMGSTRLPRKMAKEVYPSLTALGAVIERLKRATTVRDLVVATTTNKNDDALERIAREGGVRCFRGSEDDVLGRIVGAGQSMKADILVMVTGDGVCVSPKVINEVVQFFLTQNYDLVSNCILHDSYPVGIDAQVVSMKALARAYALAQQPPFAKDKNNFEHTNFFIKHHPELFRIHQYDAPEIYRRPDLAFVLDTSVDLEVLQKIYAKLYPKNPAFDLDEILALVAKEPEIFKPLTSLNVNRIGY